MSRMIPVAAAVVIVLHTAASIAEKLPQRKAHTIGATVATVEGKKWRAELTRRILADDADEGETDDLRLIITSPDGKRFVFPIVANANAGSEQWKPYLSTMRLMGRDMLVLRLPAMSMDPLVAVEVLDIRPSGAVEKIFDDYQDRVYWGGKPCRNEDRVYLRADDQDGKHLSLVKELKTVQAPHSGKCDDEDLGKPPIDRVIHYQWRDGCYLRVTNENGDGDPRDPKEVCGPLASGAAKPASPNGSVAPHKAKQTTSADEADDLRQALHQVLRDNAPSNAKQTNPADGGAPHK